MGNQSQRRGALHRDSRARNKAAIWSQAMSGREAASSVRTMKALSLWAPWGSLMADGRKKIETRSWRPPAWLLHQPIAIHQTMHVDKGACEEFGYDPLTIPRGCIVA